MERGKIREASDGNQNCKKINIICEIRTLKYFLIAPAMTDRSQNP